MSDRVAGCNIRKRKVSSIRNYENRKNDIFDPTSEKNAVSPKLKPQKWDLFR